MIVDEKKWNEKYKKLKMNQDILGFQISMQMKNQNLVFSVDAKEPLKSQVHVLIKDIVNDAINFAGNISLKNIEPEDQGDYMLRWASMFHRCEETTLKLLLEYGPEAFKEAIEKEQLRLKSSYLLEHTKPLLDNGKISYLGPSGFVFDGNAWIKHSELGTEYRMDSGLNWSELLA